MAEVRPKPEESIESLIKRFNKKVAAAGILQEVKSRRAFVKPSEKKHKEKIERDIRIRKNQKKMEEYYDYLDRVQPWRRRKNNNQNNNQNTENSEKQSDNKKHYKKDTKKVEKKIQSQKPTTESLQQLQEKFNSKK